MQGLISEMQANIERLYRSCRNSVVESGALSLKEYYKLAKHSPSIAKIVRKDTFQKLDDIYENMMKRNSEAYIHNHKRQMRRVRKNEIIAEENEIVEKARLEYEKVHNESYPYSGKIRDIIIEDGRIVLGWTRSKANFLYKIKIRFLKHVYNMHNFFK